MAINKVIDDMSTNEENKRVELVIESQPAPEDKLNADFEDNEGLKEKSSLEANSNDTEVIELDDSDGFAMSDQENQESVSISEQIEVKEVASVVEPIEAMETDSASELVHRDSEEETDSILEHVEAKVTSDCIDDLLEGDDEDTDTKENTQFIDDVP